MKPKMTDAEFDMWKESLRNYSKSPSQIEHTDDTTNPIVLNDEIIQPVATQMGTKEGYTVEKRSTIGQESIFTENPVQESSSNRIVTVSFPSFLTHDRINLV
jgi:hypothetical protein